MYANVVVRYRQFWMSKIGVSYILSTVCFGISLALTTSVETVYFRGAGFTFAQIGIIWSTYLVTSALLDFPTGNVADKLGRKTTYCTGLLFMAMGHWMYAFSHSLDFFLLGAFCFGFGEAQVSGSLVAWLVDEEKKQNREGEVGKVIGDSQLAMAVAGIVTGFLIGTFFHGPLRLLFFMSGLVSFITVVWVWTSLENNFGKSEMKWLEFQKTTLKHYLRSRALILVSMNMVLAFSCYTIFMFVYQPAAVASGIREQQLGALFSLYLICGGTGSFLFGRLCSRLKSNILMVLSFLCFGCGFVLFLTHNIYFVAAGLAFFSFGYGGYKPIFQAWSNVLIPSEIRASTNSLIGTIASGSVFLLQPIVGRLIDLYSPRMAVILGEVFVMLSIVLYFSIKKEESSNESCNRPSQ